MSDKKDKTTRDQALRVARMLGCQGAHETNAGWMPCSSHEEYQGIKKGKEEYLKVRASNNKKPLPKMVQRTKRLETKSDAYYENRADAIAISKARGCGGVRTVLLAGKKYYAVCNHKAPKRGWENLDEKPITGIATLPGGGLVTGSFSGKSLGRPIGGVADFDGDGDGFSTGPDGEDNIPAAPKKIVKRVLQHSGTKYLEVFNKHKQEQEKIHGDLSKVENATRALKKNFPNIRKIELYGDNQTTLTPLQLAHTVALLDLSSKNSKVAKTIHRVGGLGFEEYPDLKLPKGTNAACFTTWLGLRKPQNEEIIFEHSIGINKDIAGFPETGVPVGWGDAIALKMRQEGASEEDVDTFWGMYIMNHEWSHAEHNVASFEQVGADMNAKTRDTMKHALELSGMSKKSVDELFLSQEEVQKKLNPDISGKALEYAVDKAIYESNWEIIKTFFKEGKLDDLTEKEIRDLSGNYPRTVSVYATSSFNELVAEKASAARMSHPAGSANNPAWRKFHKWLNGGQDEPNIQDGMTRQQRRQAERGSQKKKSFADESYFDLNGTEPIVSNGGFIAILDSCEGFTHHSKNSEKSLGRPIGGVAEFDGDGDGFSTGPDGEDNIPAPKIPKKLFHGSTVKLNVGDYLLPPSETGVKPRAHPDIDAVEFNNTNYVYLTSKLEDAQGYGSDVVKPGQKIYIYEVEPSTDVEEDPENEIFGVEGGFRSRKAKIKKIVATLTSNTKGSMDEKGFVNFVSRSTDPDTFSDPESARIRARNIGCIGIRRYTARDGKLVWMPCTNVSDYNRATGIRGDNSPRNNPRRKGSGFGKKDAQSLMTQTGLMSFKGVPKPKKKPPTVTSTDINNLAVMVRKNNAKAKTSAKTNLRDLRVVFVRGLADGGREEANKRISKFLSLLNSDKPKDVKYSEDNDLLPIDHPWKNRKTAKKWADFEEGEYGVKYAGGCCPKVVKRYRPK